MRRCSRKERSCRSIPTGKLAAPPPTCQPNRPAVAKAKTEVRPGLHDGRRLQTIYCNAGGLYDWLLKQKPYGKDCVEVQLRTLAALFGVSADTMRRWLDELAGPENLIWDHRGHHRLCIHLNKPGDFTGNDWHPLPVSHLERRGQAALLRSDSSSQAASVRHDGGSQAASDTPSQAASGPGSLPPPLLSPKIPSPENLPQRGEAPRTPDGARFAAPLDDDTPGRAPPPDVAEKLARLRSGSRP